MYLKPLKDKLVIKRAIPEEKTKAGLIVPEEMKEPPLYGHIIAVGEEVTKVKVNEMVLFNRYGGNETVVDGEIFIILREDDCFAILEPDNKTENG